MNSTLTPEALQRLADEDLMTLVERNDADAFAVLYDRHGGAAYSLAHRIVGDSAIAEDVTQEAFLSVWRSGARFDAAREACARGRSGSSATAPSTRCGEPRARRRSSTSTTTPRSVRPSDELTDSQAIRRETSRRVQGALRELPAEQSEVIGLAYFEGFTHSEIADMLGMPLGTVKGAR